MLYTFYYVLIFILCSCFDLIVYNPADSYTLFIGLITYPHCIFIGFITRYPTLYSPLGFSHIMIELS